jgi:hypothetical protein
VQKVEAAEGTLELFEQYVRRLTTGVLEASLGELQHGLCLVSAGSYESHISDLSPRRLKIDDQPLLRSEWSVSRKLSRDASEK